MGPKCHHKSPNKREAGGLHRETQKREGDMRMEAEIGMMWPPAKKCQCWQQPEARRSKGQILPLNFQWENGPASTLILAQ